MQLCPTYKMALQTLTRRIAGRPCIRQLSNQQPKKIPEEIQSLSVIGELDKLLMG